MFRKKQKPELLAIASKVIAHEIKSFRMAAEAHEICRRDGRYPKIVMNSLIITFAVNFRNIFDFMYSGQNIKNPPKDSDVIAEDFFDSHEKWHMVCPPCPPEAGESKKQLNKQIAHITYDHLNLDDEARKWHFERMLNYLSPAIEAFYKKVDWKYFENMDQEFEHFMWHKRVDLCFYKKGMRL